AGGEGLCLRYVIFGGEALELGSLNGWVNRHGTERPALVNMYGITETTVHVTLRKLNAADIKRGNASVIGTGISDLQVYVLGENLELKPIGVPGEIFVAGAGLARGYLGKADLTADRYRPNPYADREGQRLYCAGDV